MYLIDTRKYDDSFLLAKILEKVNFTDEETKKLFMHFEIPTVDAIEVIRCKDCKYAHMTYDGECKYCQRWKEKYDGESISLYLDGDFYCAFGERREDETD